MANEKFRLVSPDPENGGRLPRKYTADGQGALKELSPPLEWYGVPFGTKSLALLVQDIDAPKTLEPIGAVGPLGGDQHTTFSQGSPCRLLSHGTRLNVFEDIQNAFGRRTNNLKEKSVRDHRSRLVSTTRDSHKSSSKVLRRDIYNFEANADIGVNSLHSYDTIYPTVDLEEDIEAIFSFSPDHFALQDSQPRAINDDPTIGDKMQEDM
ncbi:hypothetical protein MRB53_033009 [Persea americana]|uniref:Uncharacterized protein n=1 Tax=Persea americana TaxID=3435 RepID=A0ACC2KUM6_PERAE|nr:hypothetical protein MRB53_033009 [Persea americana]